MTNKRTSIPAQPPANPDEKFSRDSAKRYLVQRFYTRFHMTLILMSAGLAAMLCNWVLLHVGVGKMWMRYPFAIALSYLTFLTGIWLWLRYMGFCQTNTNNSSPPRSPANTIVDDVDLSNMSLAGNFGGRVGGVIPTETPDAFQGSGGSFDSGGASGDWQGYLNNATPSQAMMASAMNNATPDESSAGGLKEAISNFGNASGFADLDGEGAVVIAAALLLIGSVLLLSGYIVWFAPDIFGEAVFGATLASGLAHAAKHHHEEGWVMGVVRMTWVPFAIVLVLAMAFAILAAAYFPEADTLRQTLHAALS